MLGFCYHRLGMYRDAEKQLLSSMKQSPSIFGAMLLSKVKTLLIGRFDQC